MNLIAADIWIFAAGVIFAAGAAMAMLRRVKKDVNGIGFKMARLEARVQKQRYVLIVVLLAMAKSDQVFGAEYWSKILEVLEE